MKPWTPEDALKRAREDLLFVERQIKQAQNALSDWCQQKKKEEIHIQFLESLIQDQVGPGTDIETTIQDFETKITQEQELIERFQQAIRDREESIQNRREVITVLREQQAEVG